MSKSQVDARPAAAFASITRAAEYAGVSTKTVRRWIAQGRIAGYRLGRRLIRVDLNEVDGLMHRIPTSSGVPAA